MSSSKKQCLLYANCQGEHLADLLRLSDEFSGAWEVRHYSNYTRERVPDRAMEDCDFFVYQPLGAKWGEFSSESMLTRLDSRADRLCIPNMFFKGCWPFWTSESPMDYGDFMLDRLIDAGAEKPEILSVYLHGNLEKFVNLDENLDDTFSYEQEKERPCQIKTVPLVQEFWRSEMLFYAINHPAKRLLLHVANGILESLGLCRLKESAVRDYQPDYAEFELPIHPQVAEYFDLAYGGAGHEFRIFDRRMDFARYVSRYIECRMQGFEASFLGFLQLV